MQTKYWRGPVRVLPVLEPVTKGTAATEVLGYGATFCAEDGASKIVTAAQITEAQASAVEIVRLFIIIYGPGT